MSKRFYNLHPRKTGGTSLNFAFYALCGEPPQVVHDAIRASASLTYQSGSFRYAARNLEVVNRGDYFFASSHAPYDDLRLPPETFVFTSLREPTERVISHYRMLRQYLRDGVTRPFMDLEQGWLGEGFEDFVELIPRARLLNQLWTLSCAYDVERALSLLGSLDHVLLLDRFSEGLALLRARTRQPLVQLHAKRASFNYTPSPAALRKLRLALDPEYELIAKVRPLLARYGYSARQ